MLGKHICVYIYLSIYMVVRLIEFKQKLNQATKIAAQACDLAWFARSEENCLSRRSITCPRQVAATVEYVAHLRIFNRWFAQPTFDARFTCHMTTNHCSKRQKGCDWDWAGVWGLELGIRTRFEFEFWALVLKVGRLGWRCRWLTRGRKAHWDWSRLRQLQLLAYLTKTSGKRNDECDLWKRMWWMELSSYSIP